MSERITHRNIAVEPGGLARRVYGVKRNRSIIDTLDRAQHDLVVTATDDMNAVPDEHREWAYDLRRSRNRLCGGVLRFIDLLHRRGFPMETALQIPVWIEAYIRATWSKRPVSSAVPLKRVG